MTASLSFDVLLATVGRRRELNRLLGSLASQSHREFRLIVIDQNPDTRLVSLLERYADRVPLLRLTSEPGLSRARNIGLAELRGDVVAFADDDCWYPSDLLRRVSDLLGANPRWDGVSGRVVDELGRPSGGRWSRHGGAISRANVWMRGVSVSLFLRRNVVERVGGFDETLGIGAGTPWGSGEETDYLLRALEGGFALHYEPTLAVFHPQTSVASGSRTIGAGRSYGMGASRVLRKHGYPWWFASYYVARAVGGAAIALAQGKRSEARFQWAVARGRAAGWFAKPSSG
jgi:glycosyltransferase involved in cell wall biosynthesis